MSQQELLKKAVNILEEAGIGYMITGSVASSLQGEPRSTHDIDIVVAIDKSYSAVLIERFPAPDYYLDKDNMIDAIGKRRMFNLVELKSGDKLDFRLVTDEPFDRSRFSRKIREELIGTPIYVSSPEDTILAKLRWAALSGGSEKQFIDALRIYEVQYEKLDLKYLESWVKKLSLELLWKRLVGEAKTI